MGRNDRGFDPRDLDNYITGHWGEDQYPDEPDDFAEPEPDVWGPCVICKANIVNFGAGYDTCPDCLGKI